MMSLALAEKKLEIKDHVSLFDLLSEEEVNNSITKVDLPDIADWKMKQKLKFEKEALGFFVSGNPLDPFIDEIKNALPIVQINQLKAEGSSFKDGQQILIAGTVVSLVVRLSRDNTERAILVVEDLSGALEVLVFQKVYKKVKEILNLDDPILISGFVKNEGETVSFIANNIKQLQQIRSEKTEKLQLELKNEIGKKDLLSLLNLTKQTPGDCSVVILVKTVENCLVQIEISEKIEINDQLVNDLEEILKTTKIQFIYSRLDQKSVFLQK